MFIFSSLVFIFFPIISIIILILFLLKEFKTSRMIIYVAMIAFIISIIGYYVILPEGTDIYVYNEYMNIMRDMTYGEMIEYFDNYSIMPLAYTLFFCVSKTDIYNLLSFISAFIVYFIIFYIVCDYARDKKYRATEVGLALILGFLLTNFITVISGIRFHIAYSLCFLGVYREIIKKKSKLISYILYIFACLIHSSLYIILFIRVVYYFYNRSESKLIRNIINILLIMWSNFRVALISFIGIILGDELKSYIEKQDELYSGNYIIGNFNGKLVVYVQAIIFIMFIFILIEIFKKIRNDIKSDFKYLEFVKILALFLIGCLNNDILINRFGLVLSIFCIIPIMLFLGHIKGKEKRLITYLILIFILSKVYLQRQIFNLNFSIPIIEILSRNISNILK